MSPGRPQREAFFIGTGPQRRFALFTQAVGEARGALLYLPPFAEELNRSRHMAARAAQAFAQAGWHVLQIDLHGTGDSEGDFGDASWDSWCEDLTQAHAWLHARVGDATIGLWSLRAGSLLGATWLAQQSLDLPWLAWQPVFNGATYLTQFLRIRLGADLATSAQANHVLADLRASLKAGDTVTVGGYALSATLAQGLERSAFTLHDAHHEPVTVLEVGAGDAPALTPASTNWLSKWQQAGHPCGGEAVSGQKFWQSAEIETAPALVPASLKALNAWVS